MKKSKSFYSNILVFAMIFSVVVIVISIVGMTTYLATLGYTLSVTIEEKKIEVSLTNPNPY